MSKFWSYLKNIKITKFKSYLKNIKITKFKSYLKNIKITKFKSYLKNIKITKFKSYLKNIKITKFKSYLKNIKITKFKSYLKNIKITKFKSYLKNIKITKFKSYLKNIKITKFKSYLKNIKITKFKSYLIRNNPREEKLLQKKLIENSKDDTAEKAKKSIIPKLEIKETALSEEEAILLTSEHRIRFDEPAVIETAIFENNQGTKLFKELFIYEGKSYPISDMRRASVGSGLLWNLASLVIHFKNGKTIEFSVGSTSSSQMFNPLFDYNNVDYVKRDYKTRTQNWATTINMLIANNTK